MVTYIRSDLDFILAQIKISEAHAAGQPLYGPGGLIPTYNLSWGLRTVDGTYNNLLNPELGAADNEFPEPLGTEFRTIMVDADPGPGVMLVPVNYTPGVDNDGPDTDGLPGGQGSAGPGDVFDPQVRTISNLLVDQTLGNPSAILTGLQRAGIVDPANQMTVTAQISAAYAPLVEEFKAVNDAARADAEAQAAASANPGNAALQAAAAVTAAALADAEAALDAVDDELMALLDANGIELDGANVVITNAAPDEGLSAPFNSWFTLFGQFFDHGLDLVGKGGNGTVFIPLMPDDPLYVPGGQTNFMVLTRATLAGPGPDGMMGTSDDTDRPINTTTAFVDQNQTYTSHASHQVFLRQYVLNADGDPVATGRLIEGGNGGMATWKELKEQAADFLGIQLVDANVGNVPLLATDQYGNFLRGGNGFPQIVTSIGLIEGDPAANGGLGVLVDDPLHVPPYTAIRTGHAFLADIAHNAVPDGLADGDIEIGLGNGDGSATDANYDNELLDAHYIAGDGRVNENIGLTAVHHVFHAEHNRLMEHTRAVVLGSGDLTFINEWLVDDLASVAGIPTDLEALAAYAETLVWDGERLFQAAKFGTEMQYQHLVFEEFARKIQPNINVFLVPDGYDVTLDPSIVAEFAHVVYRFGHSMLTETIDRFDPDFNPDHIGLIEGFLNPLQFANNGGTTASTDDVAAGAIIRGMTRQAGNQIDEFVTSALRNNLLGLPLDLATINLARGRDTGVPTLNEARGQFYEATNQDSLLKPYESWVDFAGHLKNEASIVNFIAAYGTHSSITGALTIEGKRDAAMALVGLTSTGSEAVTISNASFEADSLADGAANVITDPLGNYTFTPPTGWLMSGTGGLFNPADGVTNNASIDGTNVVWLGQNGMLSRDTGVIVEEGATYSLSVDIGDRTDTTWPAATARLVSSDNTVLATQVLSAPADGNWSTVTFDTGVMGAALAGQTLRIEIQQTDGSGNQILVDDIRLNILQPLAPLNEEDRQAFLNGTGAYASNKGGLDLVDLWIGGLAEEIMPFGGMLGSTFNFVFEVQMENLQSGDRFYYLQRLDGLHLFGEMENNSFAAMIERNTDASHLPSDVFSTPGLILEVDRTRQYNPGLGEDAGLDGIMEDDLSTPLVDESADNRGLDPAGGGILTPIVVRNNPSTPGVDTNYLKYTGGDHVVLGGTEGSDILIAGIGDDTLYGDGGNDLLEGGFGNDIINAGDGDDIIKDTGGDDNIKAGKGHDVVHAGPGLDLVMGNDGQDFIFLGTDMGSEVFAGTGNDFIYGNKNAERILGNEGDDWIETGTFDGAPGDNFDEIFAHDGIDGNDVFLGDGGFDEFIGEGGDDIMVGSPGRGKMAGMSGFDWATYKDSNAGVNADLSIPIIFDEAPTLPQNASLDEFESMEGLSGTRFNDVLAGTNDVAADRAPLSAGGTTGYLGSALDAQGIALINGLQAVLGADVTSFTAGDIILGGDGSDMIQGNGGDDIIDGDKWLNVRIGIMTGFNANGPTGTELGGNPNIRSMTSLVTLRLDANGNMVTAPTGGTETTKTLSAWMFDGKINPGQLQIIREISTAADAVADIDTARYQGGRGEYAFSATADGQVVVTHAVEDAIDGSDRLRNIEKVQFATGNALNIIVGTPGNDVPLNGTAEDDLILGLAGADTLNGLAGDDILVGGPGNSTVNYADNFDTASSTNSNGANAWTDDWDESGDSGGGTTGQIRLDASNSNALQFVGGTGGDFNGAQIERSVDLQGATGATLSYLVSAVTGLEADDNVTVFFSRNGTTFVQVDQITSTTVSGLRTVDLSLFGTGPFENDAAIRFVATSLETGELVSIDSLSITGSGLNSGVDTLNGGLGDDTYSFALGDGNDVINEGVSATSGGTADRISILAPSTGTDIDGLPILTINALNASDNNTADNNGDLVINYTLPTGTQQTITVVNHYDGAVAGTGVERINFNGANYAGYALGADDYLINRLDIARDSGGVNLSTSTANNFIAGEDGVADVITGGGGNDLIFGGTGNNNIVGGAGDDLLVGGTGNDDLDARDNVDADNLDLVGAVGADTMVGGAGNDTYGVDDLADVVVEAVGEGTDVVETFMAALSMELMTNVENLVYRGGDADQFVGTGNAGNNVITGGDLNDTLSGLAGNDTLAGGLGADTMIGGDGNDVFIVDEAGDVVTEVTADVLVGGTDRVESDVDYTLGDNVENLDLNEAAVRGTGNALNNVINGNDENNQLFGAGGNDTLGGGDGNDLLDGGDGDDSLNGGDDTDTIIGGAGNDTIDVGGGVNTIVYNAPGFGNDVINSFDNAGGTAANQDKIDLTGLGVTAANFANRVFESASGANTLITIREGGPASTIQGTILINGSNTAAIDITDFTLAAASTVLPGATAGNDTLNGTANNDIIDGLAGADTLNGNAGNDTLSGGVGIGSGAFSDNFDGAASYTDNNGTLTFNGGWTEGGGETTGANDGDIQINAASGSRLHFEEGIDGGEFIERSFNLTGATSASVQFGYVGDSSITGTENVTVQAWNHATNSWQTLTGGVLSTATAGFNVALSAEQIGAQSAIRFTANGDWDAGDNFFIENFVINASGNLGVDTVNGGAGDDTIIWNANAAAPTDGRDIVDGGTEGAAGDTFVINGNASPEAYTIYTRAAWLAVAGNVAANLSAATEIVVTRNGNNNAAVIAELSEIEEIRINGVDPSGAGGTFGGDTFTVVGDFSTTSLRPNTITIDGDGGDDTIDISALSSAHRIVFRSNGGNDTIIGALRPVDVIELPNGATLADYESTTDENGVTTLTNGENSITYTAADDGPQVDDDDDDDDDHDQDGESCNDDDDDNVVTPPAAGSSSQIATAQADALVGTLGNDTLVALGGNDTVLGGEGDDAIQGGDGNDHLDGQGGRDVIFGGAGDDDVFGGAGRDMLYGDGGNDRIFGGAGNDFVNGGSGLDTVFGGAGDDIIVAEAGDGDDTYHGGEPGDDDGDDTLDMSAITASIVADLGTGFMDRGSVSSLQTGADTIWGFENIVTGSGNDTITASGAVNVMDGGAGTDTFRFLSAADADGDTILGFQPGDRIDLSMADGNACLSGKQAFTLVTGDAFTDRGQLMVSHEQRDGDDYTIVHLNTSGGTDADYKFAIKGSYNETDLNL